MMPVLAKNTKVRQSRVKRCSPRRSLTPTATTAMKAMVTSDARMLGLT